MDSGMEPPAAKENAVETDRQRQTDTYHGTLQRDRHRWTDTDRQTRTMEPPAASEYAVEPVGVAIMIPSPCVYICMYVCMYVCCLEVSLAVAAKLET